MPDVKTANNFALLSAGDDDDLLSRNVACLLLNMSRDCFDELEKRGDGPARYKLSKTKIFYLRRDLKAWFHSRREPARNEEAA